MKSRLTESPTAGTLLLAADIVLPGLRHHKAFAQQPVFAGGTYSFPVQRVTTDPTVPAAAFIGVINLDGLLTDRSPQRSPLP